MAFDELQADRQPIVIDTARHTDRGQAEVIREHRECWSECAWMPRA
jgi:hypothetical protein